MGQQPASLLARAVPPHHLVDVVDWAMVPTVRTTLESYRNAGKDIQWRERALTFCCEFTIETSDEVVAEEVQTCLSYLPRGFFYLHL